MLSDGELLLSTTVFVFFSSTSSAVAADDDFSDFSWFVSCGLEHSESFDVFLATFSAITLGVLTTDVVNVTLDGTVTGLTVVTMFCVLFSVVVFVVVELDSVVTAGAVSLFRLGSNCKKF